MEAGLWDAKAGLSRTTEGSKGPASGPLSRTSAGQRSPLSASRSCTGNIPCERYPLWTLTPSGSCRELNIVLTETY